MGESLEKIRYRIAGWFIVAALRIANLFRPVPKESSNDRKGLLRVETNVKTAMSPGQLAALLRRLSEDSPHAETLLSLAEGVEEARTAPEGTRGTIVLNGDEMRTDPDFGKTLDYLHRTTREMTREPGNLVEVQLSVVVASLATTVDRFPLTGFSVTVPRAERTEGE